MGIALLLSGNVIIGIISKLSIRDVTIGDILDYTKNEFLSRISSEFREQQILNHSFVARITYGEWQDTNLKLRSGSPILSCTIEDRAAVCSFQVHHRKSKHHRAAGVLRARH